MWKMTHTKEYTVKKSYKQKNNDTYIVEKLIFKVFFSIKFFIKSAQGETKS